MSATPQAGDALSRLEQWFKFFRPGLANGDMYQTCRDDLKVLREALQAVPPSPMVSQADPIRECWVEWDLVCEKPSYFGTEPGKELPGYEWIRMIQAPKPSVPRKEG
jgi:hypothetical protein